MWIYVANEVFFFFKKKIRLKTLGFGNVKRPKSLEPDMTARPKQLGSYQTQALT